MANKVSTDTLVARVVEEIESGIREGRFLPGDQLVERDLAKELGVSRSPVREALRRLAAQHILEIRPHRGAVVRVLTRKEAQEILDILIALGRLSVVGAIEQAHSKKNSKRLSNLIKNIKKNRLSVRKNQKIKTWIDLNYEFHIIIAEINGNSVLLSLLYQCQLQLYRLLSDVRLEKEVYNQILEDQLSLTEAIMAFNINKALKAFDRYTEHIHRIFDFLI